MSEDDKKKPEEEQAKLAELEKQLAETASAPKQATTSSKARPKTRSTTTTAKRSTAGQAKPQSGNGLLWVFVVFNFILIVTAAGGGFWWWKNEQSKQIQAQNALKEELTRISNQHAAQQVLAEQIQGQNAQLVQNLADVSNKLEVANAQTEANSQRLNDVSGRRPADWLLAEADYLVRMAGRKLWLERDVKTAIMMLQSADARLQDMTDPSLLPIRQLLSDDIVTLQQLNDVSTTSIALALSSLSKQAPALPLALPKLPVIEDNAVDISDTPMIENLKKQWRYFVENLIKYQPRQTPIRPMLDKEQQWLAKEQLRFALMQAQSAAMAENQTLFEQSLQRAIELIVAHFDLQVASVEQFANSLQNLTQTNLQRDLPQVLRAAQPLKDLLKQRVDAAFSNKGQLL